MAPPSNQPPIGNDAQAPPARWASWQRFWLGDRRMSGFAASFTLHALALLLVAMIIISPPVARRGASLVGAWQTEGESPDTLTIETGDATSADALTDAATIEPTMQPALEMSGPIDPAALPGDEAASSALDLSQPLQAAASGARGTLGLRRGGGVEGRGLEHRGALLAAGGGDGGTEGAVGRGLRWLAAHQQLDGGWSFDHTRGPCEGRCRNPGSSATTTGATGLALLAFLGAGQTHESGEYQDTVRQGLYYLNARMLATPHGGDLQESTMYGHALATWSLTEAYALTRDESLRVLAQQAVDFTVYAQDPVGGGWRYFPGQPGDTSVTGWQLLALKAGALAYLNIPPQSFEKAGLFLNGVQADSGANYGYQDPEGTETMSAVGLLCRMFLGWPHHEPALERGVQEIAARGVSSDNMYYNYYATQVVFQFGEPYWSGWNEQLKGLLLEAQATRGHEAGSWYFSGGQCEKGGRLLSTALAVMTLEVYYRYLPIYRRFELGEVESTAESAAGP